MNLTRVLNVALPEIPARIISQRPPRKPPDLVAQAHIEEGETVIRVVVAGKDSMFRFPPANWNLIQLFDGVRSYDEIAAAYSAETGHEYSAEEVREFADMLESVDFWYKTPQEKNIQLMQKTSEERRKLVKSRKSRFGDLSEIAFPAVNPDKFVTWLYKHSQWVYTWQFSLATVVVFSICIAISIAHWDEIGRDTAAFFAFANKTAFDLFVFYVLALITLCWHELGHAHACKHYGGRVPAMGFLLIYLTPAFYTDTSEGFVKGTRYQRFIIAMAGAWSELYICAIATPVWWASAPGSALHNAAYLLVLMTGIAGLLINWNPLMKLDGYYMLSEALGISDLKENSTAYVSGWVKRHIWKLPVDVPYVPKNRRLGYAVYALLSGAYSYTVLYILARFAGNIFRNFNPEWSFVPELAVAGLIFSSRIKKLVDFMKFVYLDKRDRIVNWMRGRLAVASLVLLVALLLVPIWRESIDGRVVLEPAKTAVIRNTVPGTVTAVLVREGMKIPAEAPLLELRNTLLQSEAARRTTELDMAKAQVNEAAAKYVNLGAALQHRHEAENTARESEKMVEGLELRSPIAGTVLTPRVSEILGASVKEGTDLVEVGDVSEMRVRVYVSDYEMHKFRLDAPATVNVDGFARLWTSTTREVAPMSTSLDERVAEKEKYKGLNPLNFYVVTVVVPNADGQLKAGMVGTAKIYGERRSLTVFFGREVVRFFGRKLW